MAQDHEPRILIVDDETLVRITLSRMLRNEHYACLEAFDYHSALAVIKIVRFNLVIADINMPGKSGIELLTVIKQKWPNTAVIMITGMSKIDNAMNCIKMGASDYITKPFDLNKLAQSIRQTLQRNAELVDTLASVM